MARRESLRLKPLIIGAVAGVAVAFGIVGCVSEDSSVWRLVESLRSYGYSLPASADAQLTRFDRVFAEFSKDPNATRELKQFRDAFVRVRADYLRKVPDAKLIDAAVKGVDDLDAKPGTVDATKVVNAALHSLVASLDPHSAYLDPDELRETYISTRGEFGGLGIEVTMEGGFVKVVSPIEGTPAYRAGLEAGDLIVALDGENIEGTTILEAVKRMRGKPGTDIRLTVRRKDVPDFDVTLTRAVITIQAVRWRTEGDFGYIRVASFTEQMDSGVLKAIDAIRAKLGPRLKGYVLDLRNNPGGLLDQSLALSDDFLDSGRIVSVRGRNDANDQVFNATKGDEANGLPLVVLINGGSASASEIVTGALQDDGRATIMGSRSFGKGSVQTITPLPIEGALKLTTALYYTPSGRTLQGQGVVPDIAITSSTTTPTQHEADLPGALKAPKEALRHSQAKIDEKSCPTVSDAPDDKQLGCAIAYLKAGSTERFLAAIAAPRM